MADIREDLRVALEDTLGNDALRKLLDEVLATTKKGRAEFSCKHCGRKQIQYADIPDAKAVLPVLTELLNQTMGRPKEAQVADQDRITFERVVYLGGEDGSE